MLYLIGLGLCGPTDVTVRGIEVAKRCAAVYIELYTSRWTGKEELQKALNKTLHELKRKDLEEGSGRLLEEAKQSDVAVFVPGDPLVATTHISLVLEALRRGIEVKIVHAPSVYSAVAATGLSIYKFGKTVSIPSVQKFYEPTSFYETIAENLQRNAHTLCLLDVAETPMTLREAIERFEEAERKYRKGIVTDDMMLITASFGEDDRIIFAPLKSLKAIEFPTPAVLIVPASLNDIEREFLQTKRF